MRLPVTDYLAAIAILGQQGKGFFKRLGGKMLKILNY
jgi:hypothetical protein